MIDVATEQPLPAQKGEVEGLREMIKQLKNDNARLHLRIQELEQEVTYDHLTGLYNRKGFNQRLNEEFSKLPVNGERRTDDVLKQISIIFLDVDHFKQYNDTEGHAKGDSILKTVGNLLRLHIRESDIPCRLGGEEMVIAFPGADEEETAKIAEKLRMVIAKETGVTVSMGVASYEPGLEPEDLIRRADQAMYKAKKKPEGRNCVERYSQFTAEDHTKYIPQNKHDFRVIRTNKEVVV